MASILPFTPAGELPAGDHVASAPAPDGRAATKARHYIAPAELRNLTRDYAAPFQFVPSAPAPLTFGEKLVAFVRRNQFRIGMVCYVLAVAVGCYFAFQMGRGL